MPGFPFGPMRPNTRAGLPLTSRVLVPAVRRSAAAVRDSGAAAARSVVRKGIVPAMATLDARICRRVRSVGLSFSLIVRVHRRRDRNQIWIGPVASIKTIFIILDCEGSDESSPSTHRYPAIIGGLRLANTAARFVETDQSDCPTGKSIKSCPAPFAKIFSFAPDPNQMHIQDVLSHRGAYRDRHGRGAGCGGRGSVRRCQGMAGRVTRPVSRRMARRRTALSPSKPLAEMRCCGR
jgi:hypothetical protein